MSSPNSPVTYTATEIRSYLPSGWGITADDNGRWNAEDRNWLVDVYDGADNTWTIEITGEQAARSGRLEALGSAIDRLTRKQLGRKSVISG